VVVRDSRACAENEAVTENVRRQGALTATATATVTDEQNKLPRALPLRCDQLTPGFVLFRIGDLSHFSFPVRT